MASYRQRTGTSWEVIVKRKLLGGKGYVTETFDTRELGEAWATRLESLLDAGIVPDEYKQGAVRTSLLAHLIRNYQNKNFLPQTDRDLLDAICKEDGHTPINAINLAWVERWIQGMKVVRNNAPVTIRHKVGALRRCFDWAANQPVAALLINPIRMLPTRYALYSPEDIRLGQNASSDFEALEDVERDRRLVPAEVQRIQRVMNQENFAKRQRPVAMLWQGATELMWALGMETAMRMREMYTLTLDQIDIDQRTVFLSKTKNGDTRQVPLSSEAIRLIECYMAQVKNGTRKMEGFTFREGRLFPWWDGSLDAKYLKKLTSKLSNNYATIFRAAGVKDYKFHDTRHEATSRLYERTKLRDTEIMKITGHRTLRQLMRYQNLRASHLAGGLW